MQEHTQQIILELSKGLKFNFMLPADISFKNIMVKTVQCFYFSQ